MRYNKLSEKAAFAVEFLDLHQATGISAARWEDFQLQFLNNNTRYDIISKARQTGFSWLCALDALVDSVFNTAAPPPYTFVSINQTEAREKIYYAKQIIGAFDAPIRDKYFTLTRESLGELETATGARFISHPCRPVRGKARGRVYLDEMAHYPDGLDREVYTAALPVTTRGGYIRIGSSPLGASGLFWEIFTESTRPYPGFAAQRQRVPWWSVAALCNDVDAALELAPTMLTEERVYKFGSAAIIEICENMFSEDFQQEYECGWVDEASAWIDWETIKANQSSDLKWWHATSVDQALNMIPEIIAAIDAGDIEDAFTVGIDVGRKHDLTEFMMLGKTTTGARPLRFSVSLDRVKYDAQESCFFQLIEQLPITVAYVDENGIGAQLAENLADRTGIAQGIAFTNPAKELWAVEARVQAQRGNVPLPPDRDIAYQIHSIKKTVTASKNNVFDTERNEKHHADKFWAWALANWAQGQKIVTASGTGPYTPPRKRGKRWRK